MRRSLAGWALLALLCVVSMFFFPAPTGSFQSVHGPTTALRALRMALLVIVAMAMAALSLRGRGLSVLIARLALAREFCPASLHHSLQDLCSIRC